MKKKILSSAIAAAALCFSMAAQALTLTPGDADFTGSDLVPPNPTSAAGEQGYIEDLFGTSNLSLYYKADVGGSDSGTYANSYDTAFDPPNDPEDAVITYILNQPAISCPECYLAVKDGNHVPSFYFFNLASWNGTETITLDNFWPGQGAISHVAIWGTPGNVPEPGSVALLGLGLAGLLASRRRRSVKS